MSTMMNPVYLDWNASTPVHPEVRDAMAQALTDLGANPSSAHAAGRRARAAIDAARAAVAALIEADPVEIVFTAGGSEANNLAIAGRLARRPGHVVMSAVEHPSVVDCVARHAERTLVAPHADGAVTAEEVAGAIRADTALVTVMRAQNETGVLQPVAGIVREVRARAGDGDILVHCDAVQAVGKTPVSVRALGVDLLSLSGHKLRGPKGAGALFVRSGVALEPIIHGGGHERGLRGGTENIAGIVGLGRAAELARRDLEANMRRSGELRDRFESRITSLIEGVIIHGRGAPRLTNTSCLSIAGVRGHEVMMRLDAAGIAISTGAACHAGEDHGSAVLLAMGASGDAARGALRISFGPASADDDVDRVVAELEKAVRRPR